MIQTMIFDMDGTLVQTEKLKASSYAKAVADLCPYELREEDVIEAFKDVVGRSRREVATALVDRFDLAGKARERMAEFGVKRPWQAFVQIRLRYYGKMLATADITRENQWSHTMDLLREARRADCKTGLATMSDCRQTQAVLEALGLIDAFDFVATRDDIERGKPHPEIYQLVAREIGVDPVDCLVIEDSPSGVQAAQAAGMKVIAMATPFTRERLRDSAVLPAELIVDDPSQASAVVARVIDRSRQL